MGLVVDPAINAVKALIPNSYLRRLTKGRPGNLANSALVE